MTEKPPPGEALWSQQRRLSRIAWFVSLWLAGVLALAVVGGLIRFALHI